MSRIMQIDTPIEQRYWTDPKFHIFTIYGEDPINYKLLWATNPEPIVQMALKNPDVEVCKDQSGQRWNGKFLLHFINSCKLENRHYTEIGKTF